MKDIEQGRAVDAERQPRAMQVVVADIQNDATAPGLASEDVVDRLGQGLDRRGQAEGIKHGQPGRLEHEAGPHRPGLFEPLEIDDVPPLPCQPPTQELSSLSRHYPVPRELSPPPRVKFLLQESKDRLAGLISLGQHRRS